MPTQQDVGQAIKQLQWRHHREANRQMSAAAGLSLVQWDVLRHLHHSPDLSLHALAELTFQTDQSMGELAKRMTARGLLAREDGPGRVVRHRLTDDGVAAYERGSDVFDGVLADTVGRLSATERATLLGLLRKALDGRLP